MTPTMLKVTLTAVAAMFAIFGVYFAWKSFKKDISNQQDQLNHLYSLTIYW